MLIFRIYLCFIFIIIILSFQYCVNSVRTQEELELLFSQRSQSDWADVWHHETHSRCRDKLIRHLNWTCQNDIYRVTRRSEKHNGESISKRGPIIDHPSKIWFDGEYAITFLRTRSRRTDFNSITGECCTKAGCTWEEYAEYCPSNKRRTHS